MDLKKNDLFTVKIADMSDDGAGIGKNDGFTWFVKDAVTGDTVEASVMKIKKSYGFARLQKILEPSPFRVSARCPAARRCGGCQLQEMDYQAQLKFKEDKVYNNLCRIGGLEDFRSSQKPGSWTMEPIMGMEDPWRYRNKAQFPIGKSKDGRIIAGFYAGRTHDIIENDDCLLGAEENKTILKIIIGFMEVYGIEPYSEKSHTGLVRHVLIRKGFSTGEIMVCLVINGETLPYGEKLAAELVKIPGMTSICCNINKEKTNVILGGKGYSIYGPQFITDHIGHIRYRISPLSFYQVNPVQTKRLYETALEYAGLTGRETVWDLYCGIGTISLFLAQQAKKVYGVEIVPQAIKDARRNAELNRMENVEFFVGKAEEVLPEKYEKEHIYADVIVVDPPRKGCDAACLDTIVKMAPERVVYVSCDSATLARDVKYLGERGYRVEKARCCDMFPMTGHCETVCLLSNRKPDSYVHLNLKMEDYYRIKDAQKEQDKK